MFDEGGRLMGEEGFEEEGVGMEGLRWIGVVGCFVVLWREKEGREL